MSLLERLDLSNIVGKLQPYVNRGEFAYSFIGEPPEQQIRFHSGVATNGPWLHTKHRQNSKCWLWHSVYFGVFRVVPQFCFNNCWKIVAANKGMVSDDQIWHLTMSDALDIYDLQVELDLPSKVGMDRRVYTPNLWGAFWYFNSLEDARANFPKIREGLNKIDPHIDLFIKRSCTEFELYLGKSDQWDSCPKVQAKKKAWAERESALEKWIFQLDKAQVEDRHELVDKDVKMRMLYWAHQHGDFSYKEFINGENLVWSFPDPERKEIEPAVRY